VDTVLALGPARGGSRGIPRKNLVRLLGRSVFVSGSGDSVAGC
jgi:CMP-N-acetylneuraminic acid synthetase